MILRLALMALAPDGFDGDFGDDPEPDSLTLGSAFEPRLLIAILACAILVFLTAVIARYAGQAVARRRLLQGRVEIAEAMYDEIDRALNRALRAPGGSQMDRARELRDLLQARFGHITALTGRPEKSRKALAEALEAEGGKIKTHDSSPAKVKIAKASEEHRILVWTQLQAFREFWDRKGEIVAMIVKAQGELVVEHPRWRLDKLEREAPKFEAGRSTPAGAAQVAAVAALTAGAATAKPASAGLVRQLEGRYGRLKKALAGRDAGAVRAILTPDFESVDVHGSVRSRADMIADATAAAADPYRISKTIVRSVKVAGDMAFVEQTYNLQTRRKDGDGVSHEVEVETQSSDIWVRKFGGWALRRTVTNHMIQRYDGAVASERHRAA